MIINCTPHDVCIYRGSDCCYMDGKFYLRDGKFYLREDMDIQPFITYPAAAEPASVNFIQKPAGMADGIPVYRWAPSEITGLPRPNPDKVYIVSKMLAQVCPERKDLIFPGTLVYDADDYVVGCIDFSRV